MLAEVHVTGKGGRYIYTDVTCVDVMFAQAVLLENAHALIDNAQRNGICEVLHAAVWICGEFSE